VIDQTTGRFGSRIKSRRRRIPASTPGPPRTRVGAAEHGFGETESRSWRAPRPPRSDAGGSVPDVVRRARQATSLQFPGEDDVAGLEDGRRLFVVLKRWPESGLRLIVIGRKRLTEIARHERLWDCIHEPAGIPRVAGRRWAICHHASLHRSPVADPRHVLPSRQEAPAVGKSRTTYPAYAPWFAATRHVRGSGLTLVPLHDLGGDTATLAHLQALPATGSPADTEAPPCAST
jgi:hypothetical protein